MTDEYTAQELQDACDVIAWARGQEWSSGRAGMMGISWGGFNCLQVAALQPEGLQAVISLCSTVDRFADDIHYKGGCMLGENFGWASQMWSYSSRPPDPEIVGARWRDMWLERLRAQPFLMDPWARHQRRNGYWEHGSVCEEYSAITAKVLSIGGWHDGYRNTPDHLVTNLPGAKGIVGPWNHKYPFYAGPEPRIGFLQEALRWWDRWLRDADTGVEDDPDMRLWLMDAIRPRAWVDARPGRWIAETDWPAPGIAPETLHFNGAELSDAPGPVAVRVASPVGCGAAAGEFFPFAFAEELPVDQRGDDALSACWTGPAREAGTDIVGAPEVTLRLAAEAETGQIAVRLTDVFPDGTSALITHGFLNLCHHESHAAPAPLTPGAEIDVTVRLDQIAYRLPEGHRLRVAVSTSYFPFLWPSPHDKGVTITGGRLALPVRPTATRSEWRFEPPEHATPWAADNLRPARYEKRRSYDFATGTHALEIRHDQGADRDLAHGLSHGATTEERWTIRDGDPLSARVWYRWTQEHERGAWRTRTETETEMWCDADRFYWRAVLKAYEGGDLVFETTIKDDSPRDLL